MLIQDLKKEKYFLICLRTKNTVKSQKSKIHLLGITKIQKYLTLHKNSQKLTVCYQAVQNSENQITRKWESNATHMENHKRKQN